MAYLWGLNGYGEGPYGGEADALAADLSFVVAAIDHVALGLSRVLKQYQESDKFLAYLTATLSIANELEAVLQSLFYLADIDSMRGVQLDTIGSIVGQSRYVPDTVVLSFFGFEDTNGAATFGEETNLSIGSRFLEEGEDYLGTTVLEDPEFRILIRARISRNNSQATPENIMAALSYLFQTLYVNIDSRGGMEISLAIGRPLTSIEKVIVRQLNLLPTPMGVDLGSVVTYDATAYFGFFGQPNAISFNEEGAPSNGAVFAEEI